MFCMRNNLIGERVRLARENTQPRMTQQALATKLQLEDFYIDRGGIAKIESGIRHVSDIELVKIAKILKVSASWLLGENNNANLS